MREVKLSYSVLKDLECPYKYYKLYIEQVQRPIDVSAVLGTVVHSIYEKTINEYILNEKVKEKPNKFFKDINNDYIQEMIFKSIEKYADMGFFLKKPFNLIDIIREVKVNLSESFVDLLWFLHKEKGYEIKNETRFSVRYELLEVYVVGIPDIFIYKDGHLFIIDIKTSKFYYSNFNKQAIFYSFILNSCKEELKYTDLKDICFAIFLSKFDRLIPITKFSNVDEIHSDFDNIVNNLVYIYKSVFGMDGITLEGIKFIHDNVEERDKETLELIRGYITQENCRFCVLKDNCPIINNP